MFVSSNSRTSLIDISLPDEKEREKFINDVLGDKNRGFKYQSDISNNLLGENKSVTMLEEINKEFGDTLNFLDNKILAMKEKIENSKNENIKGEQKGAKSKKQVNNSNI